MGKTIYTFFMFISLKLNIIARLEFKLVHYDVAVQYVSHNDTEDTAIKKWSATDWSVTSLEGHWLMLIYQENTIGTYC